MNTNTEKNQFSFPHNSVQTKLLLLGLIFAASSITQASITIDDFNAGGFATQTAPASVGRTADSSHIIWGSQVTYISDLYTGGNSTVGLNTADGYLSYDRKQNGEFHLQYAGGGTVDLRSDGSTGFLLSLRNAPPGALAMDVSMNYSYVDSTDFYNPIVVNGVFYINSTFDTAQTDYYFPFDSFAISGVPGTISLADKGLNSVVRMDFYMHTASAPYNGPGLYQFDNISTTAVPEPSEYALIIGLGLIAFASYKRFFYSIR